MKHGFIKTAGRCSFLAALLLAALVGVSSAASTVSSIAEGESPVELEEFDLRERSLGDEERSLRASQTVRRSPRRVFSLRPDASRSASPSEHSARNGIGRPLTI